jgi:DNA-binding transcriptional ArsR family regulator
LVQKGKSLATRVAALERRLATLDGGATRPDRATPSTLDLLDALAARTGTRYARGAARGAVAYTGIAKLGEREYRWAREHGVPELVEGEWAAAAAVLACLGSPVRLALLRALLHGPLQRQALQDTLGDATSGQLYHHLRDLQAARLILQRARGSYELAPAAVVPLFAIVAASLDLASTTEAEPAQKRGG